MAGSSERVALITGAGSGLGQATAWVLAEAGVRCVITGRRAESLAETAAGAAPGGAQIVAEPGDMTDAADRRRVVGRCLDRFSRLDILVNNAGVSASGPLLDYTVEQWRSVMAINLDACFFLAQEAIPPMRERGWGRIVNIGSVYGSLALNNDWYDDLLPGADQGGRGPVRQPAYHTSKGGLLNLTRDLAAAVARWGITVNCINPGMFMTEQSRRVVNPAIRGRLESLTPVGRFGEPRELGHAVRFLASDEAAFITGASLDVDGGWSIW